MKSGSSSKNKLFSEQVIVGNFNHRLGKEQVPLNLILVFAKGDQRPIELSHCDTSYVRLDLLIDDKIPF